MTEVFDFDREIDRRGTRSAKWDKYGDRDILPMWVADSDFAVAPEIQRALHERADHPVFGYTDSPQRLTDLLVARMGERYGWEIDPGWIVYLPGIVGALFLACRAVGEPGDPVYLPQIIYPPFRKAPELNDRVRQPVPMRTEARRMTLDLDWLERQAPQPGQLLLFCNPQNPGGAVYREAELARIADFADEHDLVVCSDEIHCDLILEAGLRHTPIASLNPQIEQRSITLMAPSKTFNLAGLGCAFAIVPNRMLRAKMKTNPYIVPHVNIMGYAAAEAAYEFGDEWNRQQCAYLAANRDYLIDAINRIPGLRLGPIEATYLAWIDISALQLDNPPTFFETAGVGMSAGQDFGDAGFMRLNFACPLSRLEEAVRRIRNAVESLS
jgi:cysteine-S-conjugate beta-lyase